MLETRPNLNSALAIRPFQPTDQTAVKALILEGLEDHWGSLDLSLNPDLDDIAAAYAAGTFLVGELDGAIATCGALLPQNSQAAQIVRMSVRRGLRGQGLGGQMLNALVQAARAQGFGELVLETTETWAEVIAFYRKHGFTPTHRANGDQYFQMQL